MSLNQSPAIDRRRFPRSEVLATAVVFSTERLFGTYVVQDLSAGGACLIGCPSLAVGNRVTVLVQLPGRPLNSFSARVIRRGGADTAGERFGVAFEEMNAEDEDSIHEALVNELERMRERRNASVMMMYHEGETRDGLERDLRKMGHGAIAVSTPLEALSWLERPEVKVQTVLIDLAFGPARGIDMLHFLSEQHPEIQRVVLAEAGRSFRLDLALRSGRAQAVLRKPWNETSLADILGQPRVELKAAV